MPDAAAHDDAATPPWAAALIAQVQQLVVKGANAMARACNATAIRPDDHLAAFVDSNNVLPAAAIPAIHFPADVEALRELTGARCTALLSFYGLQVPARVAAQRRALAHHLGVPNM